MKYINASGGSGGGTSSEDVTAMNSHVLEPYTAVTKESDDEPAKGTMKNLTSRSSVYHHSENSTKVLLADEAYISNNTDGVKRVELRYNGGPGYIENNTLIAYPEAQAGAKFGITADKIANGKVVLGMTGTYKGLGNATADRVLTGYSFSTSALSNANGTMPNCGAWGTQLAINGSVTVPKGFHDGTGRITQSIPTKGATTITPRSTQQTAVNSGTYCSGNILVAGDGNFVSGNIKKGVTIWGVTGTFDGYVTTDVDLYVRGNNIAGFVAKNGPTFDSDSIVLNKLSNPYLQSAQSYNWTGHNYLNVQVGNFIVQYGGSSNVTFKLIRGKTGINYAPISQITLVKDKVFNQTFSFNIIGQSITDYLTIGVYDSTGNSSVKGNIYRIWFS